MNKIKKFYYCLKNLGFYKAYLNGVSPLFELSNLIKQINKANTLIDVGSNKGQFCLLAKNFFPYIKIFSFEPQLDELTTQKKILGKNKIKYYNLALGNEEKIVNFHVTERKDSSSILKPNNLIDKNKNYNLSKILKIEFEKLDDILSNKEIVRPSILKLDVQGYELEVLKGSSKILDCIDYIITEVSFIKIYDNQVSNSDLTNFLISKNFRLKSKCNLSRYNKKLFQEDILFEKISSIKNY